MEELRALSCRLFDVIEESAYYNGIYRDKGVHLDEDLFLINGPFMMDSKFDALKREGRRVRKRKRQSCSISLSSGV